MQAYGPEFARIYNQKWSAFAHQAAPYLIRFYETVKSGRNEKNILDLCCGAGHLMAHFLEQGYTVTGLDLSENMLEYASKNNGHFLENGQAEFVHADATNFKLNKKFGLVVSTYDSLNHLAGEQALLRCFKSVFEISDGFFIFDLNTKLGLGRWNGERVSEDDDGTIIIVRGKYDGESDKAYMKITGLIKRPDGYYDRFDEEVYNTAYSMERVEKALAEVGWKKIYFAKLADLQVSLANPELEGRVFIIASK